MKKYEVTITNRDENSYGLYDSIEFRFKTMKEAFDFMNIVLLNSVYANVYCKISVIDIGGKQ